MGELRLVVAHGLLRDFSESPVTSMSPGRENNLQPKVFWTTMQIARLNAFKVNKKHALKESAVALNFEVKAKRSGSDGY